MAFANVSVWLAFLAGLASFLSPCVLTLVPAYIGYLGGQISKHAGKRIWTLDHVQPRRCFCSWFQLCVCISGCRSIFSWWRPLRSSALDRPDRRCCCCDFWSAPDRRFSYPFFGIRCAGPKNARPQMGLSLIGHDGCHIFRRLVALCGTHPGCDTDLGSQRWIRLTGRYSPFSLFSRSRHPFSSRRIGYRMGDHLAEQTWESHALRRNRDGRCYGDHRGDAGNGSLRDDRQPVPILLGGFWIVNRPSDIPIGHGSRRRIARGCCYIWNFSKSVRFGKVLSPAAIDHKDSLTVRYFSNLLPGRKTSSRF